MEALNKNRIGGFSDWATWPCGWRTCPARHGLLSGPRAPVTWGKLVSTDLPPIPRKRPMGRRHLLRQTYTRSRTPFRLSLSQTALEVELIHDRPEAPAHSVGPVH